MSELTITRVFDAPRELVWRAWVDPDQLVRWYGPRGVHVPRGTVDYQARAGAAYRLTMVKEETGEEYPTGGEFLEVDEPRRLVFTWGDPGDPASMTTVSLTFVDLGGKTEMTLHQTGLTDLHRRAGVREGWSSAFDKFTEMLGGTS